MKNSSLLRALPLLALLVLCVACTRGGAPEVSENVPDSHQSATAPAAPAGHPAAQASPHGGEGRPVWTNFELNTSVHALAFKGGEVWVGTEGGLLRYDLAADAVVARYDTGSGLLSNNVMVLEHAPDGGMWVGTHGGGLTHISDTGRWTTHSVPDLGDPFVYRVAADVSGNGYWVATWSGLSHFDGEKWRTYTEADGLVDDWVYAMVQDADGTLWLGTEGGVSAFDGTTWRTWTHADGLGASREAIGDYEVLGNPSRHHRETPGKSAEGYNPNYVLSALIDGDGTKWFGTWGAGLSRFDGKSWKTWTVADGLGGNYVTDLYADPDGTVWATTEGGVSRYADGRWSTLTEAEGLISNAVFSLTVDARGRKWFGAMGGISRLDGFERGTI